MKLYYLWLSILGIGLIDLVRDTIKLVSLKNKEPVFDDDDLEGQIFF